LDGEYLVDDKDLMGHHIVIPGQGDDRQGAFDRQKLSPRHEEVLSARLAAKEIWWGGRSATFKLATLCSSNSVL